MDQNERKNEKRNIYMLVAFVQLLQVAALCGSPAAETVVLHALWDSLAAAAAAARVWRVLLPVSQVDRFFAAGNTPSWIDDNLLICMLFFVLLEALFGTDKEPLYLREYKLNIF